MCSDYSVSQVSFRSRDETLSATLYGNASLGVILCPPHPLFGGSRRDTRIVRVARELAANNISALSVDYGSYSQGITEVQNVVDATSFMRSKVDSLGLIGYSFGAVVASNAATQVEINAFAAISILKKVDGLYADLNFDCPKLFVHGKRDNVAPYSDFVALYRKAEGRKEKLVLDTDHFYMDNYPTTIDRVANSICKFCEDALPPHR